MPQRPALSQENVTLVLCALSTYLHVCRFTNQSYLIVCHKKSLPSIILKTESKILKKIL